MNELKQRKKRGNPGVPEEIWAEVRRILGDFPQDSPKIILNKLWKAFPPEHELFGLLPTTERTIRNHMPELRPPAPTELDEPWSLGALVKYPIPPEVLPTVMEIYHDRLKRGKSWELVTRADRGGMGEFPVLTIRQALWIGRLCRIPFLNKSGEYLDTKRRDRSKPYYVEKQSVLWDWVSGLAMLERNSEAFGWKFETIEYDQQMLSREFPDEDLILHREVKRPRKKEAQHERQHSKEI